MVEGGRGSAAFLPPGADIEAEVASLAARISSPVLADLALRGRRVELYQTAPAPLHDLFAGQELVVVGRFRNERADWNVELRGTQGDRNRSFRAAPVTSSDAARNAFIPRLWAARRVAALTRTIRLEGSNPELVDEIRRLGLRFGILTEYTAYLVQEPEVLADAPMRDLRAPQAPAEQEGRMARERAALSQMYGEVSGKAAVDAANEAALASAPGASATKSVAGRIFVEREGVWHDLGTRGDVRQVRIKPFSDAYFALVRALPELAPWLSLGERVRVAGRAVTLEIDPAGIDRFSGSTVRRLVADFRP
jgi:Ca-activated chloride channel family protein